MLISDSYLSLNRELHAQGSFGGKGDKWCAYVTGLIEQFRPDTVLDYGCGQGALARSLDVPIFEYDPAIEGKNALPEPADLVICTDVLEHIEPDCIEDVLDHLASLTKKALFLNVSTRPAKKLLADGRNAHLIVEPWESWRERLCKRMTVSEPVIRHKEFDVLLFPFA